MLTGLDLLVVVFMILAGVIVLSLGLMFLLKNKKARKILFYIVSALSLYMAWVGFRIGIGGQFPLQIALGIVVALVSIASFVLERVFKNNDKFFLATKIASSAALLLGFANAFVF